MIKCTHLDENGTVTQDRYSNPILFTHVKCWHTNELPCNVHTWFQWVFYTVHSWYVTQHTSTLIVVTCCHRTQSVRGKSQIWYTHQDKQVF